MTKGFTVELPHKVMYIYLLTYLKTIIISHYSSATTAGHRPLQLLAFSLDLRLLASSYCQPFCTNHHSIWPEGFLHYVYRDAVSTPELVYLSDCRFYG
jgi:hypothetical protein